MVCLESLRPRAPLCATKKVGFIFKHLTELHRDLTLRVAVDVNKIVEALMPSGVLWRVETEKRAEGLAHCQDSRAKDSRISRRRAGGNTQLEGILGGRNPPSKPDGFRRRGMP
jgi:hypothetical protein